MPCISRCTMHAGLVGSFSLVCLWGALAADTHPAPRKSGAATNVGAAPKMPTGKTPVAKTPVAKTAAVKTAAAKTTAAPTDSAGLIRYSPAGLEAYFALTLRAAKVPGAAPTAPHDHVLLVDTSASQAGAHRKQSLAVIDAFLAALNADDRVHLIAVDVQVKPLMNGFFPVRSEELKRAMRQLRQRIPLGSTSLLPGLEAARNSFSGSRPHSVVYIGDGMSTGKLIEAKQLHALIGLFRDQKIPVNSYAVGPRTDLQLLGILAEHTGGVVLADALIDDEQQSAADVGRSMASAANATVFFPARIKLDPAVDNIFPREVPPLRSDRASVLIGRGNVPASLKVAIEGTLNGQPETFQWVATTKPGQSGNTFLAGLWANAERDKGLSVPVADENLLNLARQTHEEQVLRMVIAGQHAIAMRDVKQAEEIAWAIRQADPANVDAKAILHASHKVRSLKDATGQRQLASLQEKPEGTAEEAPAAEPAAKPEADPAEKAEGEPAEKPAAAEKPDADGEEKPEAPAKEADEPAEMPAKDGDDPAPSKDAANDVEALPPSAPGAKQRLDDVDDTAAAPGTVREGDALARERETRRIRAEVLRREISAAINAAEKEARDDSAAAISELKRALNSVSSSTDIDADIREQLRSRVQTVINRISSRMGVEDAERIHAAERQAQRETTRRLVEETVQRDQKLEQMIDRVRSLLTEGFLGNENAFEEAEAVSRAAWELAPYTGTTADAIFNSEAAGQLDKAMRLRYLRADKLLETLYQVELSHVPFPDEPPVLYPPAEVWKALSERRKKWASVDLVRYNATEERIRKALDAQTEVQFIETPLKDALLFIKDQHNINIWMDEAKISDEGVATDTPVTLQLSGVTLRSVLKLLLEPLQLTYIIDTEVMKITTVVAAGEKLQTRVYPVGDLVIPIRSPRGAGIGQGMGGAGGIGGGGGGGMMGGGGGMMGGGGGQF